MELVSIMAALVGIVGMWGSLWYKIGKMEAEVKEHNFILKELRKSLERMLTKGGD